MAEGCLFCLDKVLTIKNQQESKYILHGYNYEYSCEISFGRNRKKMVPEQCYIVTTKEDEYELEKIEFNEEGKCNYLDVLKKEKFKEVMMETQDERSMYVITNESKLFGAASMLYEEPLHELAEKIGSDLYILPSSIHEVIAVSADFGSPDEWAEMVYEINMDQVDINDRLSNQVYCYDKDLRTLRLATDTLAGEDIEVTNVEKNRKIH